MPFSGNRGEDPLTGTEELEAAAQGHAAQGPGEIIGEALHHLQDSSTMEIFGMHLQLPHLSLLGHDISITKNVVMMWVASILILTIFGAVARRRSLSPKGVFMNLFESFVFFVRDEMVYKIMGEETGRKWLPFFLTQFFFILFCNLLGLVPFGATATGNLAVTASLAIITLVLIQVGGMFEQGVFAYLKSIVPPGIPIWLYPIMVPVEILGQFTKPFALTIRLFANMTAGHIVMLSLISLIFIFKSYGTGVAYAVSGPVLFFVLFIQLLEILVAFIQAFIFTFLSIIFIGSALHPEH
jgi:F-type H+-transporting ATPase subunit a